MFFKHWKVSQVTPVYKSGDVTNLGNYRPISILSPFSKILERLVYNHPYDFVDKHNILYRYQFGFRKGHSTEQAIFEITDTLKKAMNKKLVTCGVFLDFSKAFDTVNPKIPLSKLYHNGIRGIPHDWFRNYLHNRTQFVKIGSSQSNAETITCGILQGSQLWVPYYSCFTSMTYLVALKNYRFVYLLMIQICFLQVITCFILSPL